MDHETRIANLTQEVARIVRDWPRTGAEKVATILQWQPELQDEGQWLDACEKRLEQFHLAAATLKFAQEA